MKTWFITLVLASVAAGGEGYSHLTKQRTSDVSSACGVSVTVTGGQFSPQTCVFEIITAGEPCQSNTACPPDYALRLKDNDASHIREITLFRFKTFAKETFRFDPAQNRRELNGQLLDRRLAARNLLKGEVSLEPITARDSSRDQRVRVSFDLSFSNDIHVRGSGEVPVRHVSAP